MSIRDQIIETLTGRFQPVELDVKDESHLHEGHSGWREGGETHFRVKMVADAFEGASRLQRHRMVNDALKAQLDDGLHALALNLKAPAE